MFEFHRHVNQLFKKENYGNLSLTFQSKICLTDAATAIGKGKYSTCPEMSSLQTKSSFLLLN
jgi:hypothetical protein